MKQNNLLQRLPDGSFFDWGRHKSVNGQRGDGGAQHYSGEAAEVMKILFRYPSEYIIDLTQPTERTINA